MEKSLRLNKKGLYFVEVHVRIDYKDDTGIVKIHGETIHDFFDLRRFDGDHEGANSAEVVVEEAAKKIKSLVLKYLEPYAYMGKAGSDGCKLRWITVNSSLFKLTKVGDADPVEAPSFELNMEQILGNEDGWSFHI